jgi:hypothetical protein
VWSFLSLVASSRSTRCRCCSGECVKALLLTWSAVTARRMCFTLAQYMYGRGVVIQSILLNSSLQRHNAVRGSGIGRFSRHSRFVLWKTSPHEGRAIATPIVAVPTQSRIAEPLRSSPSFITRRRPIIVSNLSIAILLRSIIGPNRESVGWY